MAAWKDWNQLLSSLSRAGLTGTWWSHCFTPGFRLSKILKFSSRNTKSVWSSRSLVWSVFRAQSPKFGLMCCNTGWILKLPLQPNIPNISIWHNLTIIPRVPGGIAPQTSGLTGIQGKVSVARDVEDPSELSPQDLPWSASDRFSQCSFRVKPFQNETTN